jgi:outer membrane autotransporter protein
MLIDASTTGTLTGAETVNSTANGQGMQGVTLRYTFDILNPNTGADQNQLWAVFTGVGANPDAKSLSESFLAGTALLNQGADLVAGWGMASAIDAAASAEHGTGFGVFGAISGGWSRYDTGSHTDMSSISLMAGLSKRVNVQPGSLVLAAFFEYGNGSYDTYTAFHGDGDLYHLGGGILGRMDFAGDKSGHFYAEGSARLGSVHNDYDHSGLYDALGREATYDASSTYYGIHLGLGYIWNLSDKAALDLYGKYFWTHQQGDSVSLSTGDPIDFDAINSHRLRVGGRYSYAVSETVSPYIGLAYEQEFDGDASATTNGFAIGEP